MPVPLPHILIFTTILFAIGLYGALSRRNIIAILISIEIMLNAVNINFIAFGRALGLEETSQVFVLFVIVLAAATTAVGLAIVVNLYRNRKTVYTDEVHLLKW